MGFGVLEERTLIGKIFDQVTPLLVGRARVIAHCSIDQARDYVQETWIHVVKNLGKFRGEEEQYPAYLSRTLVNVIRDDERKKREKQVPFDEETGARSANPLRRLVEIEARKRVRDILYGDCEERLAMRYVQGLDLDEIATVTGQSRVDVINQLKHGRRRMRKKHNVVLESLYHTLGN